MIQWEKTGRQVGPAGRTVRYRAKENPRFEIESRKRPVPHANGVGSWDYTSYWVMVDGQDVKERHSLREAKEWAEAAMEVAAPAGASAQNDGTGDPSPTEDGGPLPLGGRAAPSEGNGREDGRQIAGATRDGGSGFFGFAQNDGDERRLT